ncbi:hypothetical protein EK21DRAFT_61490 [Setomelanomma holmii]|uniref:Capsule polysaccharide biosynthesis protein n=1 Tax=Setomelanomma holmii TaxID=210430 RepID=A0A9P4HFS8_9PLEO|nr:hypothetical protein EK21DRAFT_61490 [Setomelanomma holmii]
MFQSHFPVPERYALELRYVEPKDTQTDEDIIESRTKHVPVTSEENIWTYWHAGILALPNWCKHNIISWIRLYGSDWTVRVLDTVPGSPNHALKWIDATILPEAFVKGTMTGPYVGLHSAGFLRGAALYEYGGVWMDVGCILFRRLEKICWDQLADEKSPYTISYMANHFVAARKGGVFIKNWHTVFVHFWKTQTDFTGILASPLINFLKFVKFSDSEARGFKWDFKVDESTVIGYVGQVIAWMRLTWLREPGADGFDGYAYWANQILLFDSGAEDWAAERIVGYKGADLLSVFTTKLDADSESEAYKKAEETVWRLLTHSSMQKITHGKGLTHSAHCRTLLNLPENEGKDQEKGTFGELLRWGSVCLEQTRERIEYVEPVLVAEENIIRKGVLEA